MKAFIRAGILFFWVTAALFSCGEENNPKNEVTIIIEKPAQNTVVEDPSKLELLVKLMANEQIHKFELEIAPKSTPSQLVFNYEQLAHTLTFEFNDFVDLSSFPKNTEFSLTVKAYGDHDCHDVYTKSILFST